MPYGDPVYFLDLCILAYQLHAQTLVMRADPYGENLRSKNPYHVKGAKRRERFLAALAETETKLKSQTGHSYSGPGYVRNSSSNVWPINKSLDPILSDYSRISPHLPGIVQPYKEHEGWIVYEAPNDITKLIGNVYMVRYDNNQGPNSGTCIVDPIGSPLKSPATSNAPDLLYCFEGGTGARRPAASDGATWSLMGFVLAHQDQNKQYDVHVAFRGSRSGRFSAHRGSDYLINSKGNPDWVTDLDFPTTESRRDVSPYKIHRGFATAMQTMLPTIEKAFVDLINNLATATFSGNVHVTGHSLGGALAECFASAWLFGDRFKKKVKEGANQQFPWDSSTLQVTTFGAPAVGERAFQTHFNADKKVVKERWRLTKDAVPTIGPLYFRPTGKDVPLDAKAKLDKEAAHSPDKIREEIKTHILAKDPTNDLRNDKFKPWDVKEDLSDLLVFLDRAFAKLSSRDWYNFKHGLAIYLEALSNMKDDSRRKDRFDQNEKATIQNFILRLNSNNPIGTAIFNSKEFADLKAVKKIGEKEYGLTYPIAAWLAFVVAEDGYSWKHNDTQLPKR